MRIDLILVLYKIMDVLIRFQFIRILLVEIRFFPLKIGLDYLIKCLARIISRVSFGLAKPFVLIWAIAQSDMILLIENIFFYEQRVQAS